MDTTPAATATPPDPNDPQAIADQPGHVTGVVVDVELVPIPDADVVVMPGDFLGKTNVNGAFKVGPLEAGIYVVRAEKQGYLPIEVEVQVSDDKATRVTLKLTPGASDVPYHETLTRVMFLYCAFSFRVYNNPPGQLLLLTAPCAGLIDIALQTATGQRYNNTLDKWTFDFKIEKPGFKSLVMEMIWPSQQFGTNGLMQLAELARAQASTSGVTVGSTVYGGSMAQPYHDVIHANKSYWRSGGKNITFYPKENATQEFQMLIAGYYGNTTVPLGQSALFINFRPTAYLTFFYNRQALPSFTILPDR